MKEWNERFYYGTWQFGGQFRALSAQHIADLLRCALEHGIKLFDTAAVYGRGNVELMLGKILPGEANVLTKVPAISKPELDTSCLACDCYPVNWLANQINLSRERLGREQLGVALLHNWSRSWNTVSDHSPLRHLHSMKKSGKVARIGISLPNGFRQQLADEILAWIDVVEAPLNPVDNWIVSDLQRLRSKGIEVILRSLFMQGTLLMSRRDLEALDDTDIRRQQGKDLRNPPQLSYSDVLQSAWNLGTSIVVGMTSEQQILDNTRCLEGGATCLERSSASSKQTLKSSLP